MATRWGTALFNPALRLAWVSALSIVLHGAAQAGGFIDVKGHWVRASAGFEESRYQDDAEFRFRDASARTRSVYLSGGSSGGGLLALGLNELRLEQTWWTHQTRRMLMMLEAPAGSVFTLGVNGFSSSGTMSTGGQGLGGGVEGRLPGGWPSLRAQVGWQRHWIERVEGDARDREQLVGSLTLRDRSGPVGWELGWLGQRRQGGICHGGRGLLRLPLWTGAGLQLHGLAGRQEVWYDSDRLVLHDSGQALTGMASASLEQALGPAIDVSLGGGWERVKDHESRWLYLGLAWHRTTWTP